MTMRDYHRYVTSDELANVLNVNVKTVRRLVASGDLPCVRLGRRMRFWLPDVVETLNRRGGILDDEETTCDDAARADVGE